MRNIDVAIVMAILISIVKDVVMVTGRRRGRGRSRGRSRGTARAKIKSNARAEPTEKYCDKTFMQDPSFRARPSELSTGESVSEQCKQV
jgi:hypothetical protein